MARISLPLLAACLALGLSSAAVAQSAGSAPTVSGPTSSGPSRIMAQQAGSGGCLPQSGRHDRHRDLSRRGGDHHGRGGGYRDDGWRQDRSRDRSAACSRECDRRSGGGQALRAPAPGTAPANGFFDNGTAPRALTN
ncbi:hypothetical protein M2324_001669 [Rhodovulum sulfidophilum]|uniref:hypothetical protein n=1 Tax=Rhodovulum sulfidophilum TaxID=35806 RepID=UPI0005A73F1C|nr:hypothetical protein [Rhodovulum sulfidophilum]ANB32730.1 hypothetical protein A6W98_00730 [Rhodovulum sulfidophilum DSM 1374]ANB36579.1 hypothetical protein A6024_00715 [Rhodovulum sulfidophilum]MCW2303276.1 hypothetical protein [Rhodovulum sulfidophilum]